MSAYKRIEKTVLIAALDSAVKGLCQALGCSDANAVVARIDAAFEPEDELDDALYGVLAQYVAIGHLEPQAWPILNTPTPVRSLRPRGSTGSPASGRGISCGRG